MTIWLTPKHVKRKSSTIWLYQFNNLGSSLYAFARPPFADGNMVEAEVEVHLDATATVLQKWAFSGDNFRTTFCVKVLDRAANALSDEYDWRRRNAGWADRDFEIQEKEHALLESANAVCLRWSCKELHFYKIDSTYTQAIIRCDAGRFCSCVEQRGSCVCVVFTRVTQSTC